MHDDLPPFTSELPCEARLHAPGSIVLRCTAGPHGHAGACVFGPALAEHYGVDRELLGMVVRDEWVRWAREQPDPKPSWLKPWSELTEPEREVDRRIGERLFRFGVGSR